MNETPQATTVQPGFGIVLRLGICLIILAASAALIVWINQTEPTAEQITATRKSAALVETITVERGTYTPSLSVLGTVQAAQDIMLSPRVSGQVIELSSKLIPGGMVRAGDLLLRIDPADFENAVSIRRSELEQAEASLEIEQGRQSLARKELALLEGTIDETNRALVLREPQIASIRAEVNAAKAALERSQLDLERTMIYAPFDAQVLTRSINVGSQVATSDELARLVGIDEFWIIAAVPVRSLRWLKFSNSKDEKGSMVRLRDPDAWPPGAVRDGRVVRMIGALDQQTRLARVLVSVPDPLGQDSDGPPLILQTLLDTDIECRPIENVIQLARRYVRDSDTAWVMKDGQLEIREVEVVFRDAQNAYISEGLEHGEKVVISTLATVANGIGLREVGEPAGATETSDEESVE